MMTQKKLDSATQLENINYSRDPKGTSRRLNQRLSERHPRLRVTLTKSIVAGGEYL
jgi:hypothetical protein